MLIMSVGRCCRPNLLSWLSAATRRAFSDGSQNGLAVIYDKIKVCTESESSENNA